jgi:Domain of unknown function (DUF4760)
MNLDRRGKSDKLSLNLAVSRRVAFVLGLISVLALIGSTYYIFINKQQLDQSFASFFTTAIGVTAAITSAMLISNTIESNTQARKQDRAIALIGTWNGAYYAGLRGSALRPLGDYIRNLNGSAAKNAAVEEYFAGHPDVEEQVITVLNFMEEICLSVKADLVDEELVYAYFGYIMSRMHTVLNPWIEARRADKKPADPRSGELFSAFTTLANEWRNRLI